MPDGGRLDAPVLTAHEVLPNRIAIDGELDGEYAAEEPVVFHGTDNSAAVYALWSRDSSPAPGTKPYQLYFFYSIVDSEISQTNADTDGAWRCESADTFFDPLLNGSKDANPIDPDNLLRLDDVQIAINAWSDYYSRAKGFEDQWMRTACLTSLPLRST